MTEAIENLITENRWRAIKDAPKDGNLLLVEDTKGKASYVWWYKFGEKWIINGTKEIEDCRLRHFRAIPDDRLAEVCAVLLAGLRSIRDDDAEMWPSCSARKCADEIMKRANEIATKGE